MLKADFANQFNRPKPKSSLTNPLGLISTSLVFFALVIILLPTNKTIKTYQNIVPPTHYQFSLKNYLEILEQYPQPSSLPYSMEENLKKTAKNALTISQESQLYYPNHQELISLSRHLEDQIKNKFPELLAQK